MRPIHVIGVGPGREDLITGEAMTVIKAADLVWCADRHAKLVSAEKCRSLVPFREAIAALRTEWYQGKSIAVLVSGDTGLYSMLGMLRETFGAENIEVHPGISALQLFCAGLRMEWQDACVLSAHGRPLSASALCHYARINRRTFLFLDAKQDPHWVWNSLMRGGLDQIRLTVGERLGYADASIAPYQEREYDPLCMAVIENDEPENGLPPVGMPDDCFIRTKVPMTKQYIRAQVINALNLKPNSIVWDIGAGTGSVTVECARQCPLGQVFAVEYKPEAVELICRNADAFHLLNVEIIAGRAPEVLSGLPAPDSVFLGGTEGCAEAMVSLLRDMEQPVRIVAAAVTMESAWTLMNLLKNEKDFTGVQLAVSQLESVGRYEMLKAQNPVFLFSAEIGGKS